MGGWNSKAANNVVSCKTKNKGAVTEDNTLGNETYLHRSTLMLRNNIGLVW